MKKRAMNWLLLLPLGIVFFGPALAAPDGLVSLNGSTWIVSATKPA